MATENFNSTCEQCARTGLLYAKLIKDPKSNEQMIEVEVCENHSTVALAEKNIHRLLKVGLPVSIL